MKQVRKVLAFIILLVAITSGFAQRPMAKEVASDKEKGMAVFMR